MRLTSDRDMAATRAQDFARLRYRYVRRVMPRPSSAASLLLDCGAGAGELSIEAREFGYEPVCVEIAPGSLRALRAEGFPVIQADLNAPLPFAHGTFDLVLLCEVIEHLPRAEVLLAEAARVLRPGGHCLATTPNIAYWEYRLRALLGYPPPVEGRHFRFFTRKHFLRRTREVGLRLVDRASHGPLTLLNLIIKLFGAQKLWVRIPAPLETFAAHTFVFLLEKPEA